MSRHVLVLNIHGHGVELTSSGNVEKAFSKLENDFSAYVVEKFESPKLKIEVFDFAVDKSLVENLKFRKVFRSCLTASEGDIRFNKYDESTHVKFDYKNERAEVYSLAQADQHELCYLIILSRVGKKFDQLGCHRLHAFAGTYQGRAFALSLDMGQGKSTLAFEMLKQKKIKLMSDDAPYFDEQGRLCPFHLRIGISHPGHVEELEHLGKQTYKALRRNYPDKKLLSLKEVESEQLELRPQEDFVLFFGRRRQSSEVFVKECSRLKAFILLLRPMVIGVGLPVLAEYFWEFGIRDFFVKTKIALSRFSLALQLAKSKRCYWIEFGDSLEDNVRAITEALER